MIETMGYQIYDKVDFCDFYNLSTLCYTFVNKWSS
jgi:hypothetical protein